jgi:uncharacterized protein (TIGR02266 family)
MIRHMPEQREMRLHPRLPVSLPVALKVSYPTGEALRRDFITNLSGGGVFVPTQKPLPIGTEVAVEIAIGEEAPVVLRGKVVWGRLFEPDASAKAGFGVRFTEALDPRLLAHLATAAAPRLD